MTQEEELAHQFEKTQEVLRGLLVDAQLRFDHDTARLAGALVEILITVNRWCDPSSPLLPVIGTQDAALQILTSIEKGLRTE